MRMIHVLRKPLSEGTVASNVLKHGTGGLNIDACRVGNSTRTNASKSGKGNRDVLGPSSGGGGFTHGTETVVHNHGRWPANVILQHLDGCRYDGVKRVAAITGGTGNHHGSVYGQRSNVGASVRHYAGEDGKETVANWICEPGCPVKVLDEQSGTLTSGVMKGVQRGFGFHGIYGASGYTEATCYNDKGGASRFFKQIGGKVSE